MRTVLSRAFALLLASGLALTAWYPGQPLLLGALLALYGALLFWRPVLWLLVLPMLLPVFDLTPWSGWFFVEELDLLLLVTAAVGYWRLVPQPAGAALPRFVSLPLALLTLVFAIAAWRGLLPLAPLDANAFSNYNSHYNSLRVLKGLLWALLLLPVLRRSAGPELVNLQRYFVPGMLLGLAGASLAVVWERATFPGLINFASDYRPTAPFSAMHTGGAALDAYLAISFPFVAVWLHGARSHGRLALALAILLLGSFAGFTTFSRDVFLAYFCSAAIIGLLWTGHRLQRGQLRPAALLGVAAVLLAAGYALMQTFNSSGYRGLAAATMLLGAAVILGGAPARPRPLALLAGGAVLLLGIDAGLFLLLRDSALAGITKGPYLAFVVSGAVFAAGALLLLGPASQGGLALAIAGAAFPALAVATALIAYHWGGAAALGPIALPIALACLLAVVNRVLPRPAWRLQRGTLTATFFCAIVAATLIPISGSYYLGTRFSTVGDDAGVRLRHWHEALSMMTPDWATSLFGMGLGKYPDTYFWNNTHGETPGSYSYQLENGNNLFLRLGGSQYAAGYGEVLRMLQRVQLQPQHRYQLSLDIRRVQPNAMLWVNLCERWLLYPQDCLHNAALQLAPPDGAWHHYDLTLNSGLVGGSGLLQPPVQLELSVEGAAAYADVDNVSLRDMADGEELLRNGSFSQANDYWFFSSDRNHFPWHIKNFAVNTVFETGWIGAVAMTLLLLGALGSLAMRGLHGDSMAGVYLAALFGFLVIGLFDSLFDVPRLTLLFFLVLYAASLQPLRAKAAPRVRQRRAEPAQVPLDLSA